MPQNTAKIVPVLMAGGSGTRLWPLSRTKTPKQFWPLLGKHTMLQQTLERVADKTLFSDPYILTNEDYRFLVAEQCHEISVKPEGIFLEPLSRNTGIAVALAALYIYQKNSSAIIFLCPSDHAISDVEVYRQSVISGAAAAQEKNIVTFGIKPSHPETGYGYINFGAELPGQENVYKINKFVEKPNIELATQYFNNGDFVWNSGMFMARVDTLICEIEKNAPALMNAAEKIIAISKADPDFIRFSAEEFKNTPAISFDCAVMEKTDRAVVIPVDMGWSDIGSWQSLSRHLNKDKNGNAFEGRVIQCDSKNNVVYGDSRLVALQGIENLIVVDTPDAILIAHHDQAQDLKHLVGMISKKYPALVETHARQKRPWGHYQVIHEGDDCKVKRIVINPRKSLSYQSHKFRSEHWFVLNGVVLITIDGVAQTLRARQSVDISGGVKHKVENQTDADVHMIEVQTGSYFGEDDIERYDV